MESVEKTLKDSLHEVLNLVRYKYVQLLFCVVEERAQGSEGVYSKAYGPGVQDQMSPKMFQLPKKNNVGDWRVI